MTDKQSRALSLADALEDTDGAHEHDEAAAMLRRQEELLRQVLDFLERRSMGAEHLIAAIKEHLK